MNHAALNLFRAVFFSLASAVLAGSLASPASAAEPATQPVASPATKPAAAPLPDHPAPGRLRIRLYAPAAESLSRRVGPRFGFPHGVPALDKLDFAAESFEFIVPPAPRQQGEGDEPAMGLLVWISPSNTGEPQREWLDEFAKRRLIWVCANDAGNERRPLERLALAVEAGEQIKARWKIDPARVYVGGTSGGGRCASMVAPMFPDLFRGGYYIVGCNYFRPLPDPRNPELSWRAYFPQPEPELLDLARKNSRIVLLTGETDANRPQTLSTFEHGYKQDGFLHVSYFEVPGMGHANPDAWWFGKGLDALVGKTE